MPFLFECVALKTEGLTVKFFTSLHLLRDNCLYWRIKFNLFANEHNAAWTFKPVSAKRGRFCPMSGLLELRHGEKDCDALAKLGFVATCNSEGADNGSGSKWTPDLNQYFKDRDVYIIPDNDAQGRKHAQHVARNLEPVAKSVRIVELPGLPLKGDVSDWLNPTRRVPSSASSSKPRRCGSRARTKPASPPMRRRLSN
jgi:hypothetical protein